METLKDKEQRNYCESSIAPLIEFYFSSDVKKSVLEFEKILNLQKDNPMGYDSTTHIILLLKKYKSIFGNFKK